MVIPVGRSVFNHAQICPLCNYGHDTKQILTAKLFGHAWIICEEFSRSIHNYNTYFTRISVHLWIDASVLVQFKSNVHISKLILRFLVMKYRKSEYGGVASILQLVLCGI